MIFWKSIFLRKRSLSNARWFDCKKRKIVKGKSVCNWITDLLNGANRPQCNSRTVILGGTVTGDRKFWRDNSNKIILRTYQFVPKRTSIIFLRKLIKKRAYFWYAHHMCSTRSIERLPQGQLIVIPNFACGVWLIKANEVKNYRLILQINMSSLKRLSQPLEVFHKNGWWWYWEVPSMQIRIITLIPLLSTLFGCAVEHAIVFTWLICMNGTSQYHHYPKTLHYAPSESGSRRKTFAEIRWKKWFWLCSKMGRMWLYRGRIGKERDGKLGINIDHVTKHSRIDVREARRKLHLLGVIPACVGFHEKC